MNEVRFCCGDAIYFISDEKAQSLLGKSKQELQQITDLENYIPKDYIEGNDNLWDYINHLVDSGSVITTNKFEQELKNFIMDKVCSLNKKQYMTTEFAELCYDYIEDSLDEKSLEDFENFDFTITNVVESEGIYYIDFLIQFDFEKEFGSDISDYMEQLDKDNIERD